MQAASPAPHAETPTTTPELLYLGCEVVLAGPTCHLRPDTALRLWVAAPRDARLVLELDGVALPVTWTFAADGLRVTVTPAHRTGALVLRDLDADWRWTLALRPEAAPPLALQEVHALSRAGKHDAAEAALEAALPGLRGAARAEGLKQRGDFAYMREDLPAAERAYEVAFAATRAEGLLQSASASALTAAYMHSVQTRDYATARRWLVLHEVLLPVLPAARVTHHYYLGLLADRMGDLQTGLSSFQEHARLARALDLPKDLAASLLMLGAVYGRLGDFPRADAAFTEIAGLGEAVGSDERAQAFNSAGWVALMARERGLPAEDPEPRFASALAIFTDPRRERPDRFSAAEVRINLAFAALLRADAAAARAVLASLDPPSRHQARWRAFLEGRIELVEGRPATALRRFEAVASEAAAAADREIAWNAAIRAGEALEALGRSKEALTRYHDAARMHTARVRALSVSGGRERYAATGDGAAQHLVRLLLRLGRTDEALCAARRARVQAFAGLAAVTRDPAAFAVYRDERARLDAAIEGTWDQPGRAGERARTRLRAESRALDASLEALLDNPAAATRSDDRCVDLRSPSADELLLVYFPLERGHAAFSVSASGVRGVELATLASEPAARAGQLLGPFAEELSQVQRVRVIASGVLSAEVFHALPWADARLIDHVAVAYALDLPHPPRPLLLRRATILLPPTGNLAGAPAERDRSERALRAHHVEVQVLDGDEPDLRIRLGDTDLLHYIGHARGDGWDGGLELGGERRLRPVDLLGGPVPTVVVLSGCETGLPDPTAHAGGMTLAHALLLAGASAVIATDAMVRDELAASIAPAVLAAIADGSDPAEALRLAQREQSRVHPDWARFRAFVP